MAEPIKDKNAPRKKFPIRRTAALVAVMAVLAFGAYYLWRYVNTYETTDDAQIDGHINAVSGRITGNVIAVLAEDEQVVKAGDVLVRIDPRDYEVAVAKAEADLHDAEAALETSRIDIPITNTNTASQLKTATSSRADAAAFVVGAQRQLSAARDRLESAEALVREQEANVRKTSDDVARYKLLVDKNEIPRQQYDTAVAAAASAAATLDSRRAAVREAEQNIAAAQSAVDQANQRIPQADASIESAMTAPKQVAVSEARAKSAQAQVAQKKALLEQAKLNLGYCTIVAPVMGIVGKKTVELGENISPGQQLMAVVPLDDIWVTANFKETQLSRMNAGQRVRFSVDAYGKEYSGKIVAIGGASGSRFSLLPPENATGNYVKVVQRIPVRINLDPGQNGDHRLRPGMSVDPKVYLQVGARMAEDGEIWKPKFNPWLIAVVVALAAFMEILDTSIANVALPHIAGNLGASNDESTWVLTSYLVSNAIVLPISGWLATTFGRKRFFLLCIFMFTVTSLLCGIAPSLGALVFFRVIQGAGGGGLQPMAQAILADTFPPQKRALAFAAYGITAVMAPTIGPTLGGWITDNYSWRWIFYINLPIGILTLFLVMRMVEDPPYITRNKSAGVRIDYIGVALLALGIGALQILLDKGQEDDWFGSHFIVTLMAVSAICLVSLVLWELHSKTPVVNVRIFKSFNFAVSSLMMFVLGMIFFSSLVLMPQFLQTLMGYTAESAGLVLSGAAAITLVSMPVVGQLTTKIPTKYIMAFGWLCLAFGMYYSTWRLDLLISFRAASWLRMVQQAGLAFLFVPITLSAYSGTAPEKSNSVSGLVNFMRNIGSSVGTSMVTTLLARRAQFHQSVLSYHATNYDPAFRNQLNGLSQQLVHAGASVPDAQVQAYGRIYESLQAQSQTLAYIDTFMVLAVAAGIMFLLAFIVRKNNPSAGGQVAVE